MSWRLTDQHIAVADPPAKAGDTTGALQIAGSHAPLAGAHLLVQLLKRSLSLFI
jgi:hypothetical protein